MKHAPHQHLRNASLSMKGIASFVLIAFLSLTLQPLAIAANLPAPQRQQPQAESNDEKLEKTLEALEDKLEKLDSKLTRRESSQREQDEVKGLHTELDTLHTEALREFDNIALHIKDKKLAAVIAQRHTAAVAAYAAEMQKLKTNLAGIVASKDDTERQLKAAQAKAHLKEKQKHNKNKRPKQSFDPNDLPSKPLTPNRARKLKLKKEEYTRAGLFDHPYAKLASHGNYRIDQLPSAADPAYRAESDEVVLTPAIRARAAELNHNPVKIYQFVRNSVEWLPTHGATQDAEVTLGSLRGNSMDIASLLIALLRASDIPARYVHGAIEVPADKFMNWAGGFTNINAALTFASMGGIPVMSMVSGGRITAVRLEHVWVEAAVDFQPSRAAVNRSADSWIALDASYKQYQDLAGLDVVAISGIDPNAIANSFATSGTVNEAEGWVQNLNPAVLQTAQTQAQTALENHIKTNMTNPAVGDVIGGRKIVVSNATTLAASLPYRTVTVGARYGKLPQALQHHMTFAFGLDPIREPINPVTLPWSKLNNHKVTLSFKPSTPTDEAALASFLPSGPITDPSQLPSSIPSYLISVTPEIAVDGIVVGQGYSMRLGEDLSFFYGIQRVNEPLQTYNYAVVAGSYLSVGVAGGSVSTQKLTALKTKLEQTKATLESGNTALIGALNREDILGDMFYAGILGYFGEYLALSQVASGPQNARHGLPYGYGTLGYEPNVRTLFGLVTAIKTGGIGVNIRLGWTVLPKNGDMTKFKDLNLQTGMLSSSLESGIPEQMFSTPTQPAKGVSAVAALKLASEQGQRIYHLTPANQASTLPNLRLDGLAMTEIQQGLATGREVIAHTDRISVPGFIGEGYVIFDPVSGGGAYKITGGGNGAWYTLTATAGVSLLALVLAPGITVMLPLILALISIVIISLVLMAISGGVDFDAYWSSINYMGWLVLAAHIFRTLGTFALALGAASFVPWILATFILLSIVMGVIALRK